MVVLLAASSDCGSRVSRSFWSHAVDQRALAAVLPVQRLGACLADVVHDQPREQLSEGGIMRLCGWETRSMFDRYNIIDEADLASAVAKRFNGKVTGKPEGFAEQPQ